MVTLFDWSQKLLLGKVEHLLTEGRYDRQELITWWDQSILTHAKVLVVGAGALGNEVIKNLSLLGIGNITVVDMDSVSTSNLSRCVFFREGDEGSAKSKLVAERAHALNPDVRVTAVVNPVQANGAGWMKNFDLVIGCLDNREARVWINQACRKFGVTWIDGAIEGIRGVVKVFPPSGACYECTLGEVDRAILDKRKACSLLSIEEVASGKVPTTATSSSVVAGLQSQEAVRILSGGTSPLNNRGWFMIGESFDTYIVDYQEDDWCGAHEDYSGFKISHHHIFQSLRQCAESHLQFQEEYEIQFEEMIIRDAQCLDCQIKLELNRLSTSVIAQQIECPACRKTMGLNASQIISCTDPLIDTDLSTLGLAKFDVLTIRNTQEMFRIVFTEEEV